MAEAIKVKSVTNKEDENGRIELSNLPESARTLLTEFDDKGDGKVDPQAVKEAATLMRSVTRLSDPDRLPYTKLPEHVQDIMKSFDTDASGTVDLSELASAAVAYKKSQDTTKVQQKIIVAILFILLITIGAITGLTFAVVELTKETKASEGGVLKKAGTQDIIKVASVDSQVANGVLTDVVTGRPLSVSLNLQSTSLSSILPNSAFKELKYFEATSVGGAFIYVTVSGFIKLPPASVGGLPIVKMLTPYGTITLEGTQLSFQDSVPDVFLMAGFTAEGRRKLQGVAQLVGWFQMLDAYLAQGANPVNVTLPAPPAQSKATSWTYVPCGMDCEINDQTTDDSRFAIGTRSRHGTTYKAYYEVGYTYTSPAGLRMYKAQQSYERFPDITVVEITNGTHSIRYQEYAGSKYHCVPPTLLDRKSADYGGIEMTFKESLTYMMAMQYSQNSSDVTTIPMDAKSFTMTSEGFPNVTTTYYGHETNVDIPIAISMDPIADMDGRIGFPIVFTEFHDFDTSATVEASWFNLDDAIAGCRSDTDYHVPPDAMIQAVGPEIIAANDIWGTQITTTEKQAREDAVHYEIANTLHEPFSNATSRRSLQSSLYPSYPYYVTVDGCTHKLQLGSTMSAEFTHWGNSLDNTYSCGGPQLMMAGTTTYPPGPLGLLELQANVNVGYDLSTRRFNAQGCIAIGLACDNTLKKYGLGSISNPVCNWLVLEGSVCAMADYHKVAKCQNGWEHYYVDRYGWWYCRRWSWGRCRHWARHHWRERRSRPRWVDNVASNYRLGVSGQVSAGFDFWWVGANAQAKVDYLYIDARQWQHSGNYMAIYINLSAWVGWSRFSSGFQLLPWRGDTSCANKMMVWDGIPFKKL